MAKPKYLTTVELARRWSLSVHTLRNWRKTKKGPPYFKPTGPRCKALYKLADIEAWEAERRVVAA